jgi:uncharacterized protein
MPGVTAKNKTLLLCVAVVMAVAATSAAVSDDRVENFMSAAYYGKVQDVRQLLDRGVDVNSRYRDGETALMFAALKGHLNVVKLLLERGAKVNAKDVRGNTALWYAKEKGHTKVSRLLLKHHAR